MIYKGKNKKLYHGFWFECFLLIIVPLGFYFMFLWLFGSFYPLRKEINEISARALGFGLGSVYHASCLVAGAFAPAWEAVRFRFSNLFENLTYSVKIAAKGYLYDLKSEGVEFWVYFAIICVCAFLGASGIFEYLQYLKIL
ncbi:MAG: hypothetical protein IJ306_05660 [Oscillospiraceae bacterium]|nr:hypothetical protein [Oscillospiraceae bacterium]